MGDDAISAEPLDLRGERMAMMQSGNRNRRGTGVTHIESSDCNWAERALTIGSRGEWTVRIKSGGKRKDLRSAIGRRVQLAQDH